MKSVSIAAEGCNLIPDKVVKPFDLSCPQLPGGKDARLNFHRALCELRRAPGGGCASIRCAVKSSSKRQAVKVAAQVDYPVLCGCGKPAAKPGHWRRSFKTPTCHDCIARGRNRRAEQSKMKRRAKASATAQNAANDKLVVLEMMRKQLADQLAEVEAEIMRVSA